jgi:hypothetical protein
MEIFDWNPPKLEITDDSNNIIYAPLRLPGDLQYRHS